MKERIQVAPPFFLGNFLVIWSYELIRIPSIFKTGKIVSVPIESTLVWNRNQFLRELTWRKSYELHNRGGNDTLTRMNSFSSTWKSLVFQNKHLIPYSELVFIIIANLEQTLFCYGNLHMKKKKSNLVLIQNMSTLALLAWLLNNYLHGPAVTILNRPTCLQTKNMTKMECVTGNSPWVGEYRLLAGIG